ncbi:hypothetical protein LDG_6314 [Legionella drancourtii LLAP12]|uniref:Uncharacterized protein n=1 Tax=Legionella drancourtii LLAP12 TaxID=658187 RepID=G9EM52_9GAMM|nr:hypothetical protein LDG_6314 [Legionella drancourtii LLAP12]
MYFQSPYYRYQNQHFISTTLRPAFPIHMPPEKNQFGRNLIIWYHFLQTKAR